MRSSRSKKAGLDVLVEEHGHPPISDTLSRSQSGFSSFFSRSKRRPVPVAPTLSEESEDIFEFDHPPSQRHFGHGAMHGRHYRSLSRSMNDIGALISREDSVDSRSFGSSPDHVNSIRSLPQSASSPIGSSPGRNVRMDQKKDESQPFPESSIIKQGWLNRRTSAKDSEMRLQRIYLRENKLYAYKPSAEMAIKHFDITTPSTTPNSEVSDPLLPQQGNITNPNDFDIGARSIIFAAPGISNVYSAVIKAAEGPAIPISCSYLVVIGKNDLFLCQKSKLISSRTATSRSDSQRARNDTENLSETLWSIHLQTSLKRTKFALVRTNGESCVRVQYDSVELVFHANDHVIRALYECINKRQQSLLECSRITPTPSASDTPFERKPMQSSKSEEGLFNVRQVVQGEDGRITQGTMAGFCRQIMLEKSATYDDPSNVSTVLMKSIGLWATIQEVLSEMIKQFGTLSEGSTKGKPMRIVSWLLHHSPSILLDLETSSFVLQLANLVEEPSDRQNLLSEIQACREQILKRVESRSMNIIVGTEPLTTPPDDIWSTEFLALTLNGFRADSVLSLPPAVLASQIYEFHKSYLRNWHPQTDLSAFFTKGLYGQYRNPLIFDTQSLHFITHAILRQILCTDGARISVDQRSAICSQWIRIGILLKKLGDMTGWIAVVMALCVQPIARLKSMWSKVDPKLQSLVNKEWSHVMRDLSRRCFLLSKDEISKAYVLAPDLSGLPNMRRNVVPFFGDLVSAVTGCRVQAMSIYQGQECFHIDWLALAVEALHDALKHYNSFAQLTALKDTFNDQQPTDLAVGCFQRCFAQQNVRSAETDEELMSNYMTASLRCEDSRQEVIYHKKQKAETGPTYPGSLPLIFTEILPSYRLFEASDLLDLHDSSRRARIPIPADGNVDASSNSTNLRRLNSFPPTQLPTAYTTGDNLLDELTRDRTAASASEWKMLKHLKEMTGVSGSIITFADGKLVLKDCDIDTRSARARPQSIIMEKKRESVISQRESLAVLDEWQTLEEDLEIKTRSLPNFENRPNLAVKAGSLDRLIDIMILDLGEFEGLVIAEPNLYNVQIANLAIDRPEYIQIFLSSYRSFCNSSDLMAELRRRLLSILITCSCSPSVVAAPSSSIHFPQWYNIGQESHVQQVDWARAEKLYVGIFEVLSTWLHLAPSDFLDSPELLTAFNAFMSLAATSIASIESSAEYASEGASSCAKTSARCLAKLRKQAIQLLCTPQSWSLPEANSGWDLSPVCSLSEMNNSTDIDKHLRQLDLIVESTARNITLEDWMTCYNIFKAQATEPRGFCGGIAELTSIDQDIAIRDSILLLMQCDFLDTDKHVFDMLPYCVQCLLQLRMSITKWITDDVCDTQLTLGSRIQRIQAALQLVGHSSGYMSSFDINVAATTKFAAKIQSVPSFIASAVAAALVSPESRQFSLAWSHIARNLGTNDPIAHLSDVISRKTGVVEKNKTITPCIGWIFERMLEILCYIPDNSFDNTALINFDKWRYIYNLLSNLDLIHLDKKKTDEVEDINNPFAFILEYNSPAVDRRTLRTAAARENAAAKNPRLGRPFFATVHKEHEKARRDVKQRDILEKQIRDSNRNLLRKKIDSRPGEPLKRGAVRSKYGMNSLLRAVRPLSIAISGSWNPEKMLQPPRIVSSHDLPQQISIPKGTRPALTINLVNAKIDVEDQREQLFCIRTEDGMENFFQAPTIEDLEQWVKAISIASVDGAKKRRTINHEDSKLSATEDAPQFSARNSLVLDLSVAAFGVDLAILIRRDGCSIPKIASRLIDEVEHRGLEDVGIYRISGSLNTVNALKAALNSAEPVDLASPQWSDINAVAGVFKLWLRELPEPLMTYELYPEFLSILNADDYSIKSLALKRLIHQLPVPNFSLLKRLIEHLEKITDYEAKNHMYAHNLAIVFGPNILQPMPSLMSFASAMNDLGKVQTIIRNLILQCHWIFSLEEDVEEPGVVATIDDRAFVHDEVSTDND